MPYLIDGHNLIPKIPGLNLRTMDDEIALIEILQGFCQRTGKQVEVYFDNAPPGYSGTRKYGNVTAVYVRAGGTADAAIRRRLFGLGRGAKSGAKSGAKNWTVVSSDRQVQAEARGLGAAILPAEDFTALLLQPAALGKDKPPEKLSQEEIEEWMRIFSEKPS
jgi:predicted RNA-binding protein with PIN domain